jgi:hypothetical protein
MKRRPESGPMLYGAAGNPDGDKQQDIGNPMLWAAPWRNIRDDAISYCFYYLFRRTPASSQAPFNTPLR